jgi:hypothetical protein
LYRFITDATKRKHSGAFTVLNPGATMPQCFEYRCVSIPACPERERLTISQRRHAHDV